jgi:hypothetical protein
MLKIRSGSDQALPPENLQTGNLCPPTATFAVSRISLHPAAQEDLLRLRSIFISTFKRIDFTSHALSATKQGQEAMAVIYHPLINVNHYKQLHYGMTVAFVTCRVRDPMIGSPAAWRKNEEECAGAEIQREERTKGPGDSPTGQKHVNGCTIL